jgi:O-antigen/teichoic acid export membrane protein
MTRGGGRVVRATLLVSAAHYGTLAIAVLTQLAFARLVPAAEIGAYAIAFATTEIIGALLDVSLNRAVIARLGADPDPASQHAELGNAWILTFSQTGMFLLLAFGAWLMSGWRIAWANPHVAALAALLLVAKGISKPGFMAVAVDEHRVRYGTLSAIGLLASVTGGASGVIAAWRGQGGWSLCLRDVIGNAVLTAVSMWLYRARIHFEWSPTRALGILRYSARMVVSGLTDRFVNQIDTLLLARILDLTSVGVYSYARRFVGLAINACLPAIQKVLFASYAAHGRSAEGRRLHNNASRWVFAVGGTGAVVLVLFPSEVVRVVLGPAFIEAARPLAWLAPLLVVSLVAENDRTLLMAQGRFRAMIVVRYVQCAVLATAILLVTRDPSVAVVGTAVAVVCAELVSMITTRIFIVGRMFENDGRVVALLAAAAMVALWCVPGLRLAQAPLYHRVIGMGLVGVSMLVGVTTRWVELRKAD